MTNSDHRSIAVYRSSVVFATALLIGVVAWLASGKTQLGLYHDDAIYAASGKAMAEGRGYVVASLPGNPAATKYPPLYPSLLAIVWTAAPDFPANLAALKAVNAAALVAVVLLTYLLARRSGLGPWTALAAASWAGLTPGLLGFVDLLLSELAFTALLLAFLLQASEPRDRSTVARAAALAALCTLTRVSGVATFAALLLLLGGRRKWTESLLALLVFAAMVGPWLGWRASVTGPHSALFDYYLQYERGASQLFWSAPAVALRIVTANLRLSAQLWYLPTGLVSWWLLWPAVSAAVLGGALLIRAGALRIVWVFLVSYLALVTTHPFYGVRYLVPLVPIFAILAAHGMTAILQWSRSTGGRSSQRLLVACAVAAWFTLAMASEVMWLLRFGQRTTSAAHMEFGRTFWFPWTGFAETAAWLRDGTPEDSVIASAYDTLYFMHSNRVGVRPWVADPIAYTSLYGFTPDPESRVAEVDAKLSALGVDYLVIDPLLRDGEGAFAQRTLEGLLKLSPRRWAPVFRSDDGLHRVYQRVP